MSNLDAHREQPEKHQQSSHLLEDAAIAVGSFGLGMLARNMMIGREAASTLADAVDAAQGSETEVMDVGNEARAISKIPIVHTETPPVDVPVRYGSPSNLIDRQSTWGAEPLKYDVLGHELTEPIRFARPLSTADQGALHESFSDEGLLSDLMSHPSLADAVNSADATDLRPGSTTIDWQAEQSIRNSNGALSAASDSQSGDVPSARAGRLSNILRVPTLLDPPEFRLGR